MDDIQLSELLSKNPEKIKSILRKFNETNSSLFDFTAFAISGQWTQIWKAIFVQLQNPELESAYPICLNTVRILTRDDSSIQSHNIINDFNCLLKLADLGPTKGEVETLSYSLSVETIIEALKCLCNIVFQSSDCRKLCIKNTCADRIIRRISSSTTQPNSTDEVNFFDMKLLFLITAMEPGARTRIQIDLNGHVYLTNLLDEKLQDKPHTDLQINLICEILKVLFNITINTDNSINECEIQNRHLVSVIRCLFLEFGSLANENEENVITHAINFLTNISSACLAELLVKCESNASEMVQVLLFEDWNVRVLQILLCYLKQILNKHEQEQALAANELVSPVLTVLVKCVRCNPTMRHYIRGEILPPLKDVSQRPEMGDELRNRLCRFLTLPDMILRDLSAELLFVCCKENVVRMVKYTGYGNAAGFFATRGLLDGRPVENTEYSSDSEDSDTEDYKQVLHGVNPVLGCYEAPKGNPLEGMSEEQKEYEAMELAKLMDKLHRSGLVQPCRIGEDGTPQPIEHVLQLQEEFPHLQLETKRKC